MRIFSCNLFIFTFALCFMFNLSPPSTGRVVYSVTGFLDRNKDSLLAHLSEFMGSSDNQLLSCLFRNGALYTGGAGAINGGGERGGEIRG